MAHHAPRPGPHEPRRDLVTPSDIELLVREFYRAAAMDDLLGPVFEAARIDWPSHIATVSDFWSWQLLGIPGYTGHPLRAHEPAHRRTPFTPQHFERWLALFTETVDELYEGRVADLAKGRAAKMANALQRLLPDPPVPVGCPSPHHPST